MKENSLVSIIVPAYNAASYITRCITSIINSTYRNIELIIVNDGSTDNTEALCRNFTDERIRIINNDHSGVSRARNTGIKESKGKYIIFVDADDWISEQMVEKLVFFAETHNSDVTIANNYFVHDEKGEKISSIQLKNELIVFEKQGIDQYIRMFVLKNVPEYEPYFSMGQPWGTLYNAKIIRNHELYFDENMEYKEDVHFNLYMAQFSQKIVIINQPLYFYNTVNPDSLTHSFTNKNMIVKVEKDVEGRIKYFRQFRPNDDLFKKGLDLQICRSFLTYIVPNCISEGSFTQCNKIYNKDIYKNAFKNADFRYCTKKEKKVISVIANNLLFLYYFYHKMIFLSQKYRLSKQQVRKNLTR